ncbi:hypothetical protein [Actinacidiphila acidipaludis]|uniref:Uncharacterized protein n=1 Tax=Actinacidiphila acidipaludis TaxID=2873382 RepID=A0ABS7QI20_9ACTN|nr:hypothetical protein [Streptomyces acidipaludis]MBY8882818.1 hypothetical protein [Streptomyces acidipaludis]
MKLAKQRDSTATKLKAARPKQAGPQKSWASEKACVAQGVMVGCACPRP